MQYINIGKKGLTDSALQNINEILHKYKEVKLKFLQSSPERDNFNSAIEILCKTTNSVLIKKTGFTCIIKSK